MLETKDKIHIGPSRAYFRPKGLLIDAEEVF